MVVVSELVLFWGVLPVSLVPSVVPDGRAYRTRWSFIAFYCPIQANLPAMSKVSTTTER